MRETIHEAGIHFNMPFEEYLADPSFGSSAMRLISRSFGEWWWENRNPKQDTPALMLGRAIHCSVLEDETEFKSRFTPAESKAERDYAEECGFTAMTQKAYDQAFSAPRWIKANECAAELLKGGISEVSIFWRHKETGIPLKARIDRLTDDFAIDLKTYAPKEKRTLSDDMRRLLSNDYLYPCQAAHYLDALRDAPLKMFGGSRKDRERAEAAIKRAHDNKLPFAFLFYKTTGLPQSMIAKISPESGLMRRGRAKIEQAIQNIITDRFQFGGLDKLRIESTAPKEFYEEELIPGSQLWEEV